MIYFIIFFIILLLSLHFDFTNKASSNWVLFVGFVLVLLAGFRYRVGTDTLVYMDDYEGAGALAHIKNKYLIGWYILMRIFKGLHLSFYTVQFIIAIIINYGIIKYIKATAPQAVFSCLLVYYTLLYPGWNFEILRQAICISIFLFSFKYAEQGKYLKYYILVGIACTIHETALFLLFVPLLLKIKASKKIIIIFTVFSTLLILSVPFVRDKILYYSLLLAPFQDKAAYYFREVDAGDSFNLISYLFNIVLNVLIPLIFIFKNDKRSLMPNSYIVMLFAFIVTYLVSLMLPMMYRLVYYFQIFYFVLMILFIKILSDNISPHRSRFVFFLLLMVFLLFKARVYFKEDEMGTPLYVHYYPYTSIFNEYKVQERETLDMY